MAGEKLNQVSLVNITTVAIYMFSVLGTFVLFFQLDDYRYETGIQRPELVLEVLFYSSVNIIFFLFGVIFFRRFIGFEISPFKSGEIKELSKFHLVALLLIFTFCLLVLFNYLSQLDQVAIFVVFTEGSSSVDQVRSDMGSSFSGKYHWYKLVMHDLGNLLTFTSFAIWLKNKNFKTLLLLVFTFSYSVFIAIMATEKAPVAWLLIGLFMVYFLVKTDGIVPYRRLIPFMASLIGLIILTYIFFMGSFDFCSALWSVFSRAFSGRISPAYFYLEFFPQHEGYLMGRSFPNPGGLLPFEPYNYTIEVMNWVFPENVESGVVGTAPTVFWDEADANFGSISILFIAFMIGC